MSPDLIQSLGRQTISTHAQYSKKPTRLIDYRLDKRHTRKQRNALTMSTQKSPRFMAIHPKFATIGSQADEVDVRLSYKIVELFSEGLYSSPNKAIEELVANSFDAGATTVQVILSNDLHAQDASIVVIDDGEGMGVSGMKQHWLIGISDKRRQGRSGNLPAGRQQIGQFGIGKLATYVLANRLSHVSKYDGKYYATSMDYQSIDQRLDKEVEPEQPIKLPLRLLSAAEARDVLRPWTNTTAFRNSGMKLFGNDAAASWTVAIMSTLKQKVHEIRPGVLEWVLRTALPLRDDFSIWYQGNKLVASKSGKGLLKKWVLGKDITTLSRPAPKGVEVKENKEVAMRDERRHGLDIPGLGRVSGYAEAYKDLLTGKSDEIARSNGFFVYIYGRLVNVVDGHFGISPDELRHGTFGRFRLVINIDGLDNDLRSNRENIREGPPLEVARNTLRAIFNHVRPFIERHDLEEAPGAKLSRKLASSPGSISRQPIVDLATAVIEGKATSTYLIVPECRSPDDRQAFLADLQERAQDSAKFLSGLNINYDGTQEAGLAQFDTTTGVMRINAWHPFVATFHDQFTTKTSRQPLELIAMAEILAEAHLHSIGIRKEQIADFLSLRDQLLRNLASESGHQSAFSVAADLENARNNPDKLEVTLCASFASLGFEAIHIGGKGKPDGLATAHISGEENGRPTRYAVSLEAKSKTDDSKKVAAGTVNISAIARRRNDHNCQHAIVIGRSFPTTQGEKSALAKEIADDRSSSAAKGDPKSVTLMNISDLAELVRLRPIKQIGLREMRSLFECGVPEDSKKWVDSIKAKTVEKPAYKVIIETIEHLQKKRHRMAVKYGILLNELSHLNPPVEYETEEPLRDLCRGMQQMAPGAIFADETSVALDQSSANVVKTINEATKEYERK